MSLTSTVNPDKPAAEPSGTGSRNPRIPKRIIHIWGSPSGKSPAQAKPELPLACRAAAVNARLLHPDFDYCLFDDARISDFMEREFPEYRDVFGRFPFPIQRFDFFRYLAIYRLGGFYLDLDVYLARSLATLCDQACVFPFEELTLSRHLREGCGFDWEVGNYAFGAEAGHPFLLAVIKNCVRSVEDPAWALQMYQNIPSPFRGQFIVTNTTGPGLVTRTLAENPGLRSSVTVLFPTNVCEPKTWHRFGDYGAHLMGSSWRKSEGFFRTRLARYWENATRRRNYRASLQTGPKREGEWISSFPESGS